MEGFPTPESIPTKQEIIGQLKAQGLNPETLALVNRYFEQKEKEVTTARGTVELNIERIDFYFAVGDREGAWDVAKDAYENARREGEENLCDKLLQMFPELDMKLER